MCEDLEIKHLIQYLEQKIVSEIMFLHVNLTWYIFALIWLFKVGVIAITFSFGIYQFNYFIFNHLIGLSLENFYQAKI